MLCRGLPPNNKIFEREDCLISLLPSSPMMVANIYPPPRSMDPTRSVMPTTKGPEVTVPGMAPRPMAMRPMTGNANMTETTHVSETTGVAEMTHMCEMTHVTAAMGETTHVAAHMSEMSTATTAAMTATAMTATAMTATVTS